MIKTTEHTHNKYLIWFFSKRTYMHMPKICVYNTYNMYKNTKVS